MLRLLDGVRVVEWAEGIAAPFCARILADLGAEVVKVEPPITGDPMRAAGPFLPGERPPDSSALFAYLNAGKSSAILESARDLGRHLEGAALLIESHGVTDPDALRRNHPDLAVLSVTPFGRAGPLRDVPSSNLTLQHRAAWAHAMARPVDEPEALSPRGGADHEAPLAVGVAAAVAAIWGLLVVQAGGAAPCIDIASYDVYAHLAFADLAEWSAGERAFGRLRVRREGTEAAGGLTWILPCATGWVMVSPREQHQWDKWVALLGNPPWSTDAALCATRVMRRANFFPLQELMAAWSRRFSPAEVARRAQEVGVACFPVSSPGELLDNAQLLHRGFFDRLRTAGGEIPMPGLPFCMTSSGGATLARERSLRGPALGGTEEVRS